MREELKEKEVLAMYNVRRIQSYIFKSNAAKEIVGASELIEGIIVNGLERYIKSLEESEKSKYMIDWTHDDAQAFLKSDSQFKCRCCLWAVEMPMYYSELERFVRK